MALNTFNSVNEGDRHEKIAVIANDLSKWRWYSHNGKDGARDFPVTDKYTANITPVGIIQLKDKETGKVLRGFSSSYLTDIDNIKNNVLENEKEDAWQKADRYLAENILRAIEKQEKEENDKKASTKKDLGTTLEGANSFGKGFSLESLISMFKETGFDRTKLFGDTKINPVSVTAEIPSSAKKSPDNSRDKVQPVESSQSQIDSNIDINDIIRTIIEKMAPNGTKAINKVRDSYTPQIIAIIINPDGTVKTETTTSGKAPENSSSSQEKNNPVINDAIKDFIQKTTQDGDYTEISLDELNREKSQKTKPVSSNFSGIKNAIAGLKKAAAATQEAQEPNQGLINMVNRLSQMNKQIKNAKVDIPTPNYDAAVENESKELEKIGAIMDSYNTMIKWIPGIIAGIDKTTTGNEATIDGMKAQLEDLGKNIENYIQNLTKKVEEITRNFGTQNHDPIIALCEKLQKLAGTFEKATAAVSGTGNKTPEKKG